MTRTGTYGSAVTLEELEHDPYPVYKRLRDEEPVSYVEAVGLWLVTRWADVNYVDKTPDLFTGETEPSTLNRTFGKNLLGSEGPYHQRIRSIIYPAFRVQAIGHYPNDVIAPIANELVDAFVGRGEVEFVSEFAEPLSTKVVKRALGLAEIEDDTLRRWFVELATGAANFEGDPGKQAIADNASREVNETVQPILDRLEESPDDTLLSSMLHLEVEAQRLTREEIQSNLKVMIVGGLQAGTDLIALSLWALLAHPEQAEQVKADPSLINQAIEEGARWHSPVGTSTRQTTRETELAGVRLEKGSLIAAVLASANRDERNWTDPDRYDIHRRDGAHLAFATGPHLCIGARLGRYEARTAWRVLFERLPNLRLDPDRPIELSGWEFRSPHHLHLLFDAP
ncbi:MAG: cytochrome P450 [Thermoleophilia bacterium]|nr:cytochrome P450 [Thermoleophilia bacterium]MDQ3858117.1 cytochrome P450 [Actinomycetota bacterium]